MTAEASPEQSKRIRLGILVPSSNTALEPLSTAIVSSLPNISVHFSRFPVTEIALSPHAISQFDEGKIIAAASLLADAKVDVIGWSGTSSGWLGLDADRKLCAKIEEVTGIRATTSVLALSVVLDMLHDEGRRPTFGLVTPYLDEVQDRIIQTFPAEGYDVVAESHLRKSVNVRFADIGEDVLDDQVEDVVRAMGDKTPKVVSTFCTNLRAAQRVAHWEEKYPELVVADTVATVLWKMLKMADVDTSRIRGWGKMFEL